MTPARTTARGAPPHSPRVPAHAQVRRRRRARRRCRRSSSRCSARRPTSTTSATPAARARTRATTSWRRAAHSRSPPRPARVKFQTTSSRAGCMLYLYGESGTDYLYIHLNNDLTSGNDNQGKCVPGVAYAKGLKNGAKVLAGRADRLRRRLRRRGRDPPAPPLRGAPERRRRRQPVPVPAQGEAAALRSPARDDVHARADGHGRDRRAARTSSSASTRCARGRAGARSSSPARRSASSSRRRLARGDRRSRLAGLAVLRARAADEGAAGDRLDGAGEGDARSAGRREGRARRLPRRRQALNGHVRGQSPDRSRTD